MKTTILMSALALCAIAPMMTSCREKGPAEKIGESLDKAGEDIKDAVDPKGPVEKAGEKVDKALGN
jgi:ABC-type transporter MlaC component